MSGQRNYGGRNPSGALHKRPAMGAVCMGMPLAANHSFGILSLAQLRHTREIRVVAELSKRLR